MKERFLLFFWGPWMRLFLILGNLISFILNAYLALDYLDGWAAVICVVNAYVIYFLAEGREE